MQYILNLVLMSLKKDMATHSSTLYSGLWKSHRRRSLVGYSPWGHAESDMTEQLHFHFSLSCIGERNSNPLHYSCLENPSDRGAWWAAVYGVSQSQTRLKWLSSSSSWCHYYTTVKLLLGFPGGSVVKNLPANAGDVGSVSGWRRASGEGNGNPL